MPARYLESRDAKTADLHVALSAIENKLAALPADETIAELRAAWSALVTLLALPPNHELRECPTCKQVAMRQATRCGHCWTKLTPVAIAAAPDASIVRGDD